METEYGLELLGDTEPPKGGFPGIKSRHAMGPCAWFALAKPKHVEIPAPTPKHKPKYKNVSLIRKGHRIRYSGRTFRPDSDGEYETLNEVNGSRNKDSAEFIDNFLLEADDTNMINLEIEKALLKNCGGKIAAETLYAKRLELQERVMEEFMDKGIVWRAVYSGMKSIHGIVQVFPAPVDLKERRWLFAYLCKKLGGDRLVFDPSVGDPTRLTRAPVTLKRTKIIDGVTVTGMQRLLAVNERNLYHLNWRPIYEDWAKQDRSRYERRGTPMLPLAEIYKEAAKAFMDGTYFTDHAWDGQRQATFFPMYRIIRALNYSEQEFWDALEEQIVHYHKPEDRDYWRTRRDSRIIGDIEAEFKDIEGYR
jgi:hypothetical protein